MYKRSIEKTILESLKHYPILLLSGPRQVGKSTLLYNLLTNKGYSYVSLDDQLELMMAKNDPRTFLASHPTPLIIDEAQKASELFIELERIVNEKRLKEGDSKANGMYVLSGSQRKQLIDDSKESLAGRVCILDMTNFSLSEIYSRNNIPFSLDVTNINSRILKLNEDEIYKLIFRGFFPALYNDKDQNINLFYSSYLSTYLSRDLKEITEIQDEVKFYSFLKLLASNTGEELIYDNYSKQIGVATNTIKNWISTLIRTQIIYLVEPYNENSITKRIVKRPKMYFFDTGLACFLTGIDSYSTLKNSFLKGRFFETFVMNEIKKTYINEGININLYYYRDTNQNEVDLILIKNGMLSCIEIKSGQSFNVSDSKNFKQLNQTKLIRGNNAIICSIDKLSILNDGTYLIPVTSI